MENEQIVNCKNCKYFFEKHINKNSVLYGCQKSNNKHIYPENYGILDDCLLSMRKCYTKKEIKTVHGKNNKRRHT